MHGLTAHSGTIGLSFSNSLMKSKQQQVLELEAELLRLNSLVRQRRKQLAFLEKCPNKNCECRRVWRQVVEKDLAQQVGKIGRHVRGKRTQTSRQNGLHRASHR
jgi:hypothetical protein